MLVVNKSFPFNVKIVAQVERMPCEMYESGQNFTKFAEIYKITEIVLVLRIL